MNHNVGVVVVWQFSVRTVHLFAIYLKTLFQWLGLYSIEGKNDRWMMICKGCGRSG